MTLAPLLDAPAVVQAHLVAALAAAVIGPLALYSRRRGTAHRLAGRAWVMAMAAVAGTGLAIPAGPIAVIGPFGPIHLLSLAVLWWLWEGVAHIRAGRVAAHRESMQSLYWNALGIAALFTLIPGRLLPEALFGDRPQLALVVMAAIAGALIFRWRRRSGGPQRAA